MTNFKHECPEWDFAEIDEKMPEFKACLCFTACTSKNPTNMCPNCDCWKKTREMCS